MNGFKYFFLEEFAEILTGDTGVNLVVYRYRHAVAVALACAEAPRKRDVVVKVVVGYRLLEHFNYTLRALEVAGASHANLNYQRLTHPCKYLFFKELGHRIRAYREELTVHRDAYPLAAFTHAEGSAEINLFLEAVLGYKALELLHYRS